MRLNATKTDASGTTAYNIDEMGNLLSVTLPAGTEIDYLVDGQNRRIAKTVAGTMTRQWIWSGTLRIAAELDGTGALVSRFVYATHTNVPDYMIRGGITYRLITDHLGSVRLVVDASTGAIAQRLDYDEFGRVLGDSNAGFQPFGFAGGMYDTDTGLVRFGVRDYDSHTGRWTAKDPIRFDGGDTELYQYVGGDPVSRTDPGGLVTSVVVFYNGFAWHSGLSIDSTNGEEPLLYDPSGGYEPPSGVSSGSGRVFYGPDANLDDYIGWHQTKDSSWTVFNFNTTPAEERVLRRRAEEQGGGGALDCAQNVSTVLSGVGRFKGIKPTRFPGILANQLRDLLFHRAP